MTDDKAGDKGKSQRRVYMLPPDLVERLVAFQNEMGIGSEVEAARRLLDEALKHREDWHAITRRFQERLKETKMMSDIARDVLVGHPKILSVRFSSNDAVAFETTDQDKITIFSDAKATVEDRHGRVINLDKEGADIDELPF